MDALKLEPRKFAMVAFGEAVEGAGDCVRAVVVDDDERLPRRGHVPADGHEARAVEGDQTGDVELRVARIDGRAWNVDKQTLRARERERARRARVHVNAARGRERVHAGVERDVAARAAGGAGD